MVTLAHISDVDPMVLQITLAEMLADGCSFNNMDADDPSMTTEYWMPRIQPLFRFGRQYTNNRLLVGAAILIDFGAQHKVVCDTLNGQKLPFGDGTLWLNYTTCVCKGCMKERSVSGDGFCNECGEEGHYGGDPMCSVMFGVAERRQERQDSQQAS